MGGLERFVVGLAPVNKRQVLLEGRGGDENTEVAQRIALTGAVRFERQGAKLGGAEGDVEIHGNDAVAGAKARQGCVEQTLPRRASAGRQRVDLVFEQAKGHDARDDLVFGKLLVIGPPVDGGRFVTGGVD